MSHISSSRLFTQAEWDVLERVEELRKTRGVGDAPIDERDAAVAMAAAFILSVEEMDGDDTPQHGWGPK